MKEAYTIPELSSVDRQAIYAEANRLAKTNPMTPFANYLNATVLHVLDMQIREDVHKAYLDGDYRERDLNLENLEVGDFLALVEGVRTDRDPDEDDDEDAAADEVYHDFMYLGGDMFYDGHGCIDLKTLKELVELSGCPLRQLEYIS